ncbi:chemotaxis protein CheB [Mucilaginibacter antarcticus]|uniref:chemotaxis protein CheB n=1 Tax=Mucilaginibacter antarcticus TaxID=1855725 RepID=UPI00364260D9
MSNLKHIIVVGASAGGFQAITNLLSVLPDKLPTAVFVVMHLGKGSSSKFISEHFDKFTSYECRIPEDHEKIAAGTVYIAPPDFHMLVTRTEIRLIKGAKQNRFRPAIDVLFRSATAAFDSSVIGIVLSGMMDDGTSGMSAIKRAGGICIVQDPQEAAHPDMPENVLKTLMLTIRYLLRIWVILLTTYFQDHIQQAWLYLTM